jgi:hypothetical protein
MSNTTTILTPTLQAPTHLTRKKNENPKTTPLVQTDSDIRQCALVQLPPLVENRMEGQRKSQNNPNHP